MRPELVKTWLQDLQSKIVAALEAVDGQPFVRDGWTRPTGGGGGGVCARAAVDSNEDNNRASRVGRMGTLSGLVRANILLSACAPRA